MKITLTYSKEGNEDQEDFDSYYKLGKWITENCYKLNIISIKVRGIQMKKLRMRHILVLEQYGCDISDFLYIKEDSDSYTFYQKSTGKEVVLRR